MADMKYYRRKWIRVIYFVDDSGFKRQKIPPARLFSEWERTGTHMLDEIMVM